MKIDPKKPYFHGSPCTITAFDYKFTERGIDAHGSGFYFASEAKEVVGYCEPNANITDVPGVEYNPAVHEVRLDIKNAIRDDQVHPLSLRQVVKIIEKAPDLLETMSNWGDLGSESLDSIILRAARPLADNDEGTLIHVLNLISSDFYDGHVEAFNRQIKEMLGYDGLIRNVKGLEIVVAWFPEQIEIVKYHSPDARFELDSDDPSP